MMKKISSMSERLKKARIDAGYKSATSAIKELNWADSTYRAHENGQNNFKVTDAEKYANAYGVSNAWLLLGEDALKDRVEIKRTENSTNCSKETCVEKIYAISLLLVDDPNNISLVVKLSDCVDGYLHLIGGRSK